MTFCFVLKILCDLSFYFSFANLITSTNGGGRTALWSLPLFALCAAGGHYFQKHKASSIFPLALAAVFAGPIMTGNPWEALILAPPYLYVSYLIVKKIYITDHYDHSGIFFLFLKCYFPFFILLALMGKKNLVEIFSFPFALVFVLLSIALLRTLRHDSAVIQENKFKLINFLGIALILAAAIFMSTPAFLSLAGALSAFLYRYLIAPVITVIGIIVMILMLPFILLLVYRVDPEGFTEQTMIEAAGELGFDVFSGNPNTVNYTAILTTAGILLFLALSYFVFRKLLNKNTGGSLVNGVSEKYYPLQHSKKERNPLSKPQKQIRRTYRKFMLFCIASGIPILPEHTTKDIELLSAREFKLFQEAGEIREIYLDCRYNEAEAGKEQIIKMKELLAVFKKHKPKMN